MVQDIQTSVPVGQPYNPTFRLTACVNVTPAFLQVPAVHISLLSMVPQVSSSKHILWKTEQAHIMEERTTQAHIMEDRTAQVLMQDRTAQVLMHTHKRLIKT